MEAKHHEIYEAPTTDVTEVKLKAIICQSGNAGVQDYYWNEYQEE